ncbi:sensor histidine kinase [Geothrix sp. PMB-07]|uniref:sensor histidine kinase n=1 Tax=Geothrix sp. PMB-07 TaxID=3068640 RepID=UPI0027424F70|nr:HAMP domain-containing sensor histidine kinase [Geothrix sp. PMB-07]WLT30403.1 HAMP domain-containing sensor histidine kinase [Geothrix sp. PMB-07]
MLPRIRKATPVWLLCGLGLAGGWVTAACGDPWRRGLYLGIGMIGSFALAALGAYGRAREEAEMAKGWRTLGASFALMGLFGALSLARLLALGAETPPPPPLEMLSLASLILVAWSWYRFQPGLSRSPQWSEFLLDGGNFVASLLLGYWLLFLHGLFAVDHLPLLDRIATLCFVVGVGSMAGLFGHAARQHEKGLKGPMGFMSLALFCLAFNLPFLQALVERKSWLGHPSQVGLIPCWLLFIATTRRPFPGVQIPLKLWGRPVQDLLPYAPLVVALPVLIYSSSVRRVALDPLAMGILVVLLVCLGARHLMTLGQVRRLNQTLEDRVEERTRELAEAQALLVRTERMNVLATLGAGAVHDINNLLAAAMSSSQLMLEEDPGLPPHIRQRLESLHKTTETAGRLTKRLMVFGNGEEPTGPLAFDAQARLQHLVPLLRTLVPRHIDLEIQQDDRAFILVGEPQAFDQVIVNLVSNARDAISGRGRICIRSLQAIGDETRYRLEVEDTGEGIPHHIQHKIFDSFFTTKPPGIGTGLGLSSIRVIIEAFGGSIEVDSSPGAGATFRVLFPLLAAQAE